MDKDSFQEKLTIVEKSDINKNVISTENKVKNSPVFSPKSSGKINTKTKHWIIGCSIIVGILILIFVIIAFLNNGEGQGCIDKTVIDTDGNSRTECLPVDEKPIIYLYPTETTNVSVRLGYPDKLAVSYPAYNDGWELIAEADGSLTDLNTGREFYGLYWEGEKSDFEMTSEGFVVESSEAAEFLEEKLAILGLNEREANEFIVYWLPRMQQNQYNYVRFASLDEIESYMPLSITPTPDTVIRVMMILKPLDAWQPVSPQQFMPAPKRSGFTVVEWGGTEV